jgi:hypothetical protein
MVLTTGRASRQTYNIKEQPAESLIKCNVAQAGADGAAWLIMGQALADVSKIEKKRSRH